MLGKTPWIDRAFLAFWDRVKAAAPKPAWIPRLEEGRTPSVVEFGCGAYGCAVPTHDPSVLVKMTSDPSEAAFAVTAMKLAEKHGWPSGIVRYYAAYNVPNVTYRKRSVAILWRDEAIDVGTVVPFGQKTVSQFELAKNLDAYKNLAMSLREMLVTAAKRDPEEPWRLLKEARALDSWAYERFEATYEAGRIVNFRGAEKLAGLLQLLSLFEQEMQTTDMQDSVGEALGYYHRHGLVLADVHVGNIGRRVREGDHFGEIVITDPGHAVPLERELARVVVPSLP